MFIFSKKIEQKLAIKLFKRKRNWITYLIPLSVQSIFAYFSLFYSNQLNP